MEKYIVNLNGSKVAVEKGENGRYILDMPRTVIGERVKMYTDEQGKWCYTSRIDGNPIYYTDLSIDDEGNVEYTNDLIKRTRRTRLDSTSTSTIFPQDIARTLSTVKTQVEALERYKSNMEYLRKKKLVTVLRLLGVSVDEDNYVQINSDEGYCALSRIGSELEKYINLAPLYQEIEPETGDMIIRLPDDLEKEKILSVIDEVERDSGYIEEKNEFYERIRDILPDYGRDMSAKIPEGDRKKYYDILRKVKELYLGLNYDLLDKDSLVGIEDLTHLQGVELEDRISKLIDSHSFDEACNIEDTFMIREADIALKHINFMEGNNQAIKMTGIGKSFNELRTVISEDAEERSKRDKVYKRNKSVYEKGNKIILENDDVKE